MKPDSQKIFPTDPIRDDGMLSQPEEEMDAMTFLPPKTIVVASKIAC